MTFEDWVDKYQPIARWVCQEGEQHILWPLSDGYMFIDNHDPRKVWTWVGRPDGAYLIPGFHEANKLAYYITREEWVDVDMKIPIPFVLYVALRVLQISQSKLYATIAELAEVRCDLSVIDRQIDDILSKVEYSTKKMAIRETMVWGVNEKLYSRTIEAIAELVGEDGAAEVREGINKAFEEGHMKFEEWVDKYQPVENHFHPGEGLDTFETFGEEYIYVTNQDLQRVWTWVEGDGGSYIIPGVHWVNRIGYYITEKPWDDEDLEIFVASGEDDK